MTIDIQALIEKRPHLRDPLELYAKWQRFHVEAEKLLKDAGPAAPEEGQAYPLDASAALFRLFALIFDLPEQDLAPLCRELEQGRIDFMRLPIGEVPAVADLSCSETELGSMLFLFSRSYFLALRRTFPLDGTNWEEGRCPLCSARPALSSVVEGPKRSLHCSFCGTTGSYRFIGCPNCGTTDTEKLNTIMSEDEPGFRVSTCDECRTYVKMVESSVLTDMTMDLADMASLPLDIVAQGKGYARLSPNPISLVRME